MHEFIFMDSDCIKQDRFGKPSKPNQTGLDPVQTKPNQGVRIPFVNHCPWITVS
jgi:hypothetical protein